MKLALEIPDVKVADFATAVAQRFDREEGESDDDLIKRLVIHLLMEWDYRYRRHQEGVSAVPDANLIVKETP
ncbi:MAG: hypothetical protein V3V96_14710 [Acidiferrobacterales bacterium]